MLAFFTSPLFKYGAGAIAIGLLIWFAVDTFNDFKRDLIRQGVEQCQADYKKQVEENDKRNREVEQSIATALQDKLDAFTEEQESRKQQATSIISKIEYRDLPANCEIPQTIST